MVFAVLRLRDAVSIGFSLICVGSMRANQEVVMKFSASDALGASQCTVLKFRGKLTAGAEPNLRSKFAEALQVRAVEDILQEFQDGILYLGDWRAGEIQVTGIEGIVTNRFWTEVEYDVLFPPKQGDKPAAGTYRSIRWNAGRTPGASALCITKDFEVVLVRSFRHAVRRWCLEIPRGARLPDEPLEKCAIREAQQECGVILTESSEVIDLGPLEPDTGIIAAEVPTFLISNCVVDPNKVNRDVSESRLGPVILSRDDLRNRIRHREIKDALLLAALTQASVAGYWNW